MEKYRMLCSVPECKDKESRRHRFPEDPVLFKIWLERIGNSKLLNKDKKAVRITNLVCERHFSEKCLITSKLKKNSLPTLHIPGLSKNLAENSFYIPPDPLIVRHHSEHSYCKKMDLKETLILPVPLPYIDLQLSVLPSTSKSVERSGNLCGDLQLSVATPSTSKGLSAERIGNLCTGSTLKRKRAMLNEIDVHRQLDLTRKAKHFYSVAVQLRRKAYRVSRKCLSFKSRLREAEKLEETQLHFIDKVNDSTYNFIMSQVRNQHLKPNGRRFTRDDKILALSFYKRSPKCYRLLQKVFALPSSKTLSLELQKVPLTTGFNERSKIVARRYNPNALCLPHTNFSKKFIIICRILQNILPKICNENNIMKNIKQYIFDNIDLSILVCERHPDIPDAFVTLTCKMMLHTWCKNVNKILHGQCTMYWDLPSKSKIHQVDDIKELANIHYQKSRKSKKRPIIEITNII